MKISKLAIVFTVIVIMSASFSSIVGVLSWENIDSVSMHVSVRGDSADFVNQGIYQNNPGWFVAEGIAWDFVTLFAAIPLLIVGLIIYLRGSAKGQMLLIAMLVYFAYMYFMCGTGWAFNNLFLVYCLIAASSLLGIAVLVYQLKLDYTVTDLNVPFRGIAVFSILVGLFIGKMWIEVIIDIMLTNQMPEAFIGLNYLDVQAFDLSIVVPLAITTGIVILRKLQIGIPLAYVIITKGMVMSLAIIAMVLLAGVRSGNMQYGELIPFSIFLGVSTYFFIRLMSANKRVGNAS